MYRFRFSFIDPADIGQGPVENHFRFVFLNGDAARAFEKRDSYEGLSQDFNEQVEAEFGLHDVGFNPQTEIMGFGSDEVERERWVELMERWRGYYQSQGLECGPVEQMHEDPWA